MDRPGLAIHLFLDEERPIIYNTSSGPAEENALKRWFDSCPDIKAIVDAANAAERAVVDRNLSSS